MHVGKILGHFRLLENAVDDNLDSFRLVEKPPTILFRNQVAPIAQSNDGKLIVYPGAILHLECLWIRKYGTPTWEVSHSYRKYPEGIRLRRVWFRDCFCNALH